MTNKDKKFVKLVNSIIKDCEKDGEPVTRQEAEEMAEMELGYRGMNHYTQSEKPRKKRSPRTYVASDEKQELFSTIVRNLDRAEGVLKSDVTVLKDNKLVAVKCGDKYFKVDLIQVTAKKLPELLAMIEANKK